MSRMNTETPPDRWQAGGGVEGTSGNCSQADSTTNRRTFNGDRAFLIPQELRDRAQWITWRYLRRSGDPKPQKVPTDPQTGQNLTGYTKGQGWMAFADAVTAFEDNPDLAGVGYVLDSADPFVGVDMDHCLNPDTGELADWAKVHIDEFATYTEASPSGTGVRMFVRGELPAGAPNKAGDREVYQSGRFLTVTGNILADAPETLPERPEALHRYCGAMRPSTPDTEPHSASVEVSETIPEGDRDTALTSLAGTLRRRGLTSDEIADSLRGVNARRCRPPVDDGDIQRIAGSVARYEAADPLPTGEGEQSQGRRFRLIRAGELEFKAPRFLVREYLEADSLGLVFGDPGCGKSFLAVDMACCIATGQDFHALPVEAGPVIYVAGEGHNGLKRRFTAWEIRNGHSLDDAPLYVSTAPAALCDEGNALEVATAVNEVAEASGAPALVVIDTLARNFGPGDENSTQDMGRFVFAADMIRSRHECTVLLVHHTGHADKQRARGAMALKGALDAEYRMDVDDTGVIRLEATKMKDAPPPDPMAFRLHTVELGIKDHDGREITSAVLDETSYAPPAKSGRQGRGKWQTVAVEQLQRLHRERRANMEADGRDPDSARVSVEDWRDACRENGVTRQRWPEVRKSLEENSLVVVENGFAWPGIA